MRTMSTNDVETVVSDVSLNHDDETVVSDVSTNHDVVRSGHECVPEPNTGVRRHGGLPERPLQPLERSHHRELERDVREAHDAAQGSVRVEVSKPKELNDVCGMRLVTDEPSFPTPLQLL